MANFIKNFKNQNYNDAFLPQSVLEELSKKWNGNLEYVYKENGTYMLEATNGKVELGFKNFEIRINERRILKAMAAYSGFAEEDYDTVFIILDKMDKIGLDGVAEELAKEGYAKESIDG